MFLGKQRPEAAGAGHKDIVSALRLSKANVDAVDEYGNTVPPAGMGVGFFSHALFVSCHGSGFPKFDLDLAVNHGLRQRCICNLSSICNICLVFHQRMISFAKALFLVICWGFPFSVFFFKGENYMQNLDFQWSGLIGFPVSHVFFDTFGASSWVIPTICIQHPAWVFPGVKALTFWFFRRFLFHPIFPVDSKS